MANDRLNKWGAPTSKDYVVNSIYLGKYVYGLEQTSLHSGFKITFKTDGDSCKMSMVNIQ
jgi:hypothetical protein